MFHVCGPKGRSKNNKSFSGRERERKFFSSFFLLKLSHLLEARKTSALSLAKLMRQGGQSELSDTLMRSFVGFPRANSLAICLGARRFRDKRALARRFPQLANSNKSGHLLNVCPGPSTERAGAIWTSQAGKQCGRLADHWQTIAGERAGGRASRRAWEGC